MPTTTVHLHGRSGRSAPSNIVEASTNSAVSSRSANLASMKPAHSPRPTPNQYTRVSLLGPSGLLINPDSTRRRRSFFNGGRGNYPSNTLVESPFPDRNHR